MNVSSSAYESYALAVHSNVVCKVVASVIRCTYSTVRECHQLSKIPPIIFVLHGDLHNRLELYFLCVLLGCCLIIRHILPGFVQMRPSSFELQDLCGQSFFNSVVSPPDCISVHFQTSNPLQASSVIQWLVIK